MLCGSCSLPLLVLVVVGLLIFAIRFSKKPNVSKTKKTLVWVVLGFVVFVAAGILAKWIMVEVLLRFIPRY